MGRYSEQEKCEHSYMLAIKKTKNGGEFGSRADYTMILLCMRLVDHATLNLNSNLSMTAVFLNTEKAFTTTM